MDGAPHELDSDTTILRCYQLVVSSDWLRACNTPTTMFMGVVFDAIEVGVIVFCDRNNLLFVRELRFSIGILWRPLRPTTPVPQSQFLIFGAL